jgi:hypothetical protein
MFDYNLTTSTTNKNNVTAHVSMTAALLIQKVVQHLANE